MRSIWKGTVSFGLVSIGVKLYTATEEKDISFHQVRRSDGSRIRYKRVAEADGAEVAYGDIAKGYQMPSGDIVVLTDEDLAELPLPTSRTVDVLQFVPADEIDPIYFAKSYYLEPEKNAVKPYVLLRDALAASGMVGIVKVAIRNRERLAALRVRDGVIVMETMSWPDEVRNPDFGFLDEDVTLRPQERQMAQSLVESMAGDFEPAQFSDDYREALAEVIEAKVEGREVVEGESGQPTAGKVVDLMAALRASVEAAKRGRGEFAAAPDEAPAGSASADSAPPARTAGSAKAPGKKAPAKKAQKAPARKTPGRKAPEQKAPARTAPAKATAKSPAKSAAKSVAKTPARAAKKPARKAPARKSA